jgi:hypothetical protein
MVYKDSPAQRDRTRAQLLQYMEADLNADGTINRSTMTPPDVARHVEDEKRNFATDRIARQIISADTVRRFIQRQGRTNSAKVELLYRFLVWQRLIEDEAYASRPNIGDGLSTSIWKFFSVEEKAISECKSFVSGTYVFYANSEDRKDASRRYIVRGAIRFYYHEGAKALSVEERQESRPIKEDHDSDEKRLVELHHGIFLDDPTRQL